MAKYTRPMFETGPDDQIATPDIYNEPVSTYVPVQDEPVMISLPVGPSIIRTNADLKDLAPTTVPKEPTLEEYAKEMEKIDPASGNILNDMTEEEKSELQKALDKVKELPMGFDDFNIVTPLGEIGYSKTEGLKVKGGLKIVSNLLNDLPICGQLFDMGLMLPVLKAAFDLSLDIEINECITGLIDKIKSEKAKLELLKDAAKNFAKNGKLDGLKDIKDKIGGDKLFLSDGKIGKLLVGNFEIPNLIDTPDGARTPVPQDYPSIKESMVATLDDISDKWNKYTRGDQEIVDITLYEGASPDAKKVLGTDKEHQTAIAVAELMKDEPTSLRETAQKQYPLGYIGRVQGEATPSSINIAA